MTQTMYLILSNWLNFEKCCIVCMLDFAYGGYLYLKDNDEI